MSEFDTPSLGDAPDHVSVHIEASGSLDPTTADELRRRVHELFADMHGLSYSVRLGEDEPEIEVAEAQSAATEAEPLQRWLSSSLREALSGTRMGTRTANYLSREHIMTPRDALLLGETELLDIGAFGEKSLDELRAVVNNNEFGLALQAEPTLADAALICDSLDQLPIKFIDAPELIKPYWESKSVSVADIRAMSVTKLAAHYASQALLHLPPDEFIKAFEDGIATTHTEYVDHAEAYKQRAEECARHFAALKAAR